MPHVLAGKSLLDTAAELMLHYSSFESWNVQFTFQTVNNSMVDMRCKSLVAEAFVHRNTESPILTRSCSHVRRTVPFVSVCCQCLKCHHLIILLLPCSTAQSIHAFVPLSVCEARAQKRKTGFGDTIIYVVKLVTLTNLTTQPALQERTHVMLHHSLCLSGRA